MNLSMSTERQGVFLRQLSSNADDLVYFTALDANRGYVNQFSGGAAAKYLSWEAVREERLHPSHPDKLMLGIWDKPDLVGGIDLTPGAYDSAEITYWLDHKHTGKGYAALAIGALGKYGRKRYSTLYTRVAEGDTATEMLLRQEGYSLVATGVGELVLALRGIVRQKDDMESSRLHHTHNPQDLEKYAELPSRKESLRAKDKNNLSVFISFGIAKKLYRCFCCRGDINIGDSHAVFSRVQMSQRFTHHHVDFICVRERILPDLTKIQVIDAKEASAAEVHARGRRYRNKRR